MSKGKPEFYSKKEVILHKKLAIKKLSNLLDSFLNIVDDTANISTDSNLKKVNLLSYWFQTYANFLKKELTFDPSKNKSYKRGEIIQADLGFRIGHEQGGLHYAIVIDKNNSNSSDLVTIIPLSSKKETTKSNRFNVDLGNEIYNKLQEKYLREFQRSIKNVSISPNPAITGEKLKISVEIDTTEADKIQAEINLMKKGSIALVSQITTISKIRIKKPLRNSEPFANIKLSNTSMDLIDKKIRELYIGK